MPNADRCADSLEDSFPLLIPIAPPVPGPPSFVSFVIIAKSVVLVAGGSPLACPFIVACRQDKDTALCVTERGDRDVAELGWSWHILLQCWAYQASKAACAGDKCRGKAGSCYYLCPSNQRARLLQDGGKAPLASAMHDGLNERRRLQNGVNKIHQVKASNLSLQ